MYLRTVLRSRPVRRAMADDGQPLPGEIQDHDELPKCDHPRPPSID